MIPEENAKNPKNKSKVFKKLKQGFKKIKAQILIYQGTNHKIAGCQIGAPLKNEKQHNGIRAKRLEEFSTQTTYRKKVRNRAGKNCGGIEKRCSVKSSARTSFSFSTSLMVIYLI